jgi:ABC-type branched-subunit amino acid transport system substrate-binding protein
MAGFGAGWRRLNVLVAAGLVALAAAGPAGAGDALKGSDLDQARRLYSQLRAAHDEHRARQSLELAGTLLDYYPSFDRNDEVLTLAVDAAASLGDGRHALTLTDELLADHPDSPLLDGALDKGAQIAIAGGDSLRAAHYRLLYYDRDPVRGQRDDGAPYAAPLFDKLSAGQLADLVVFHPGSSLVPYLQWQRVRRLLGAARDADARSVAAELEVAAPGDRWTVEALALVGVAAPGLTAPRREPYGPVRADLIGVLCPQSGRYAELGGAVVEAARQAAAAAGRELGHDVQLVVEDTAGDPVAAALAARRLCLDRGVIALFGDLLSDPTTAAAVVARQFDAPLVSPTATNDRIWEIGPNVFQTNLTGLYEPRLLARLARTVLLKESFAVLYPDEPEGRRHAETFAAEVTRLGGRVALQQAFAPDAVDFQAAIAAVRQVRPEVVFIPASVAQMVLLGPQLEHARTSAVVMGLSTWNSPRLALEAGVALEGAIFPADHPLYPPAWAETFDASWPASASLAAPETRELAQQSYQAMRMLVDTLVGSGVRSRGDLAEALRRRLTREELDVTGPDTFTGTVRVLRDQQTVPFPAALFAAGWEANPAPGPTAGR